MSKIKIIPPQRPLTVMFCLPGKSFSGEFLEAWSELMMAAFSCGIVVRLIRRYDPVIYYCRNKLLCGDVLRGKDQKPFDGKADYDYIMWIDSDILFQPEQVWTLVKRGLPIVSGVYMMADALHYAAVKNWDVEFFKKNGCFQFLTPEDLGQELTEVDYSGFGFMLIQKGVFESLEYPWFRPVFHDMGDGMVDFSSEDVSFCRMVKEAGYKIFVDPTVRVGHEKTRVF